MKATVHNTIDVMSSQHVSNVSKREAVVSLSVESWDVKTMRTVSVRCRTSARRKTYEHEGLSHDWEGEGNHRRGYGGIQ